VRKRSSLPPAIATRFSRWYIRTISTKSFRG